MGEARSNGSRMRISGFFLPARLVIMFSVPAPLLFGFAPGTTDAQRIAYGIGVLLIELGGLVLILRPALATNLTGRVGDVLPFVDIVALTLMGYSATPVVPDPIFPIFLIWPALYALMLPRRRALVVGAFTAVGYAIATVHVVQWRYYDVLVFVEKLVAIGMTTWIVAAGADLLRRRVEQMQLISGIAETVHTSLDAELLPADTARQLAEVLGLRAWRLSVVEDSTQAVLFDAELGPEGITTEVVPMVSGANDRLDEETVPALFDPGDAACEKLLGHEDSTALFCAIHDDLDRLTDEDRLVLQAVARELLVALENRRLYGITKHQSVTDSLTGLYNRRYLMRRIAEETGRAHRFETAVSLLMLDCDDFKSVNDRFGHQAGDEVLVELASLMHSAVRDMDVVARYGGEEFCVLLPETDALGARMVAEKLCAVVSAHRFQHGVSLTVSVGAATFPDHGRTSEELQQAADGALYQAKEAGKNRVATPVPRRGFAS